MGAFFTEEHVISRSQYLDLVYSQLGTMYDLIPNGPRPMNDPSKPLTKPPMDGLVGSIKAHPAYKSGQSGHSTYVRV